MLRFFNFALIALILAVAAWTFQVKHEAEMAEEEIAQLKRALKLEHETIDILEAEWANLNDPERLQQLVERFGAQLNLQDLEVEQIITVDELPIISPNKPDDVIADKIELFDDMPTGSVREFQNNQIFEGAN